MCILRLFPEFAHGSTSLASAERLLQTETPQEEKAFCPHAVFTSATYHLGFSKAILNPFYELMQALQY